MELKENIEYSKIWLTKEIIKTDFKEKENNKKEMITISKKDLFKLIIKFIKLNEKGNL